MKNQQLFEKVYNGYNPELLEREANKANLRAEEYTELGFEIWTAFYRNNFHRFIEDYFGFKGLKTFQKILLYMMNENDQFVYIASRGQGKSYIIAWFIVTYCTLNPNSRIIVSAGTRGQAGLIITEKIVKDFMANYPNVCREIKEVHTGVNKCMVVFKNGSTIEAVTSTDNARGFRAHILILDEFRMIDLDILKKVLRRFLATPRQPKYLNNPKYAHLQERNKEIAISSAWYKSHWSWDKFVSSTKMMLQGKRYFTCALPYTLSIHHGLLTKEQIENERLEDDFDPIGFEMEMSALFFAENQYSYFKLDDLQKNRTLVKAFYPQDSLDYTLTWKSNLPKVKGEIRIIGVDVALMKGEKNDNTIFSLIRLVPNGQSYQRQLVYMEHMNGQHSEIQAIRLKQLYADFEADKVVLDTMGNGMAIYDSCVKTLYDRDRDIEYPAWTCFNDKTMAERCLSPDAEPIIYSMKVNQASLNHEIATSLREDLKKGKIKLLSQEIDAREHLGKQSWFKKLSEYDKMRFLMPYQQTTVLINEMINLEYQVSDAGFIKVMEKGSARKDRYSSFAYANYLAKVLEQDLLKMNKKTNISNFMFCN